MSEAAINPPRTAKNANPDISLVQTYQFVPRLSFVLRQCSAFHDVVSMSSLYVSIAEQAVAAEAQWWKKKCVWIGLRPKRRHVFLERNLFIIEISFLDFL